MIQKGLDEGAQLVVDGRGLVVPGYEAGNFVRPTILADVPPGSTLATTEVFGPVLGLMHVDTVEDAIALVNSGEYGNMACIFTSSGAAARKFRYEAQAGNIGINIGVAAPMAFFPFSGWKQQLLRHAARAGASTPSSSSRRRRWWSSAGWGSGRGSSEERQT